MNSTLLIITVSAAALVIAGGIVAWFAMRHAPQGYEDAEGFHVTNPAPPAEQPHPPAKTHPGFAH